VKKGSRKCKIGRKTTKIKVICTRNTSKIPNTWSKRGGIVKRMIKNINMMWIFRPPRGYILGEKISIG
jgi:hypothetical protein